MHTCTSQKECDHEGKEIEVRSVSFGTHESLLCVLVVDRPNREITAKLWIAWNKLQLKIRLSKCPKDKRTESSSNKKIFAILMSLIFKSKFRHLLSLQVFNRAYIATLYCFSILFKVIPDSHRKTKTHLRKVNEIKGWRFVIYDSLTTNIVSLEKKATARSILADITIINFSKLAQRAAFGNSEGGGTN